MKYIKEILEENRNIEKQLKTSEKCLTDTPPGLKKYNNKYNPAFTPLLLKLLYQLGCTDKQACKEIGISVPTLHTWKKKYEEVNTAIKQGKSDIDKRVENSLLRRAIGFFTVTETETIKDEQGKIKAVKIKERTVLPDTNSAMWWLSHRMPEKYSDKVEHNVCTEFMEMQLASIFSKKDKVLKFDKNGYKDMDNDMNNALINI